MTIADDKAALRRTIRARRAARSADDRAAAALALADRARPLLASAHGMVTLYLSLPTEPGTDALVNAALDASLEVLLPRIAGRDLAWVPYDGRAPLDRGPLGIREPQGPVVADDRLRSASLMLVPGLAVDRAGRRLGQGGGYYDRVLSGLPSHTDGGPLRVAVLFDDEIVDEVPAEEHDQRVDAVLTPGGVTSFS